MPTSDDRRHFNDAIVTCCEGRWNAVLGFEIANEYRVNRWNDAEVQAMGRDLRAKVPSGTLIALSAPHREGDTKEDMLAAMQRLYAAPDFGGASIMTIHRDRDERSSWHDPFSYNGLMPELQKVDNEPSGQGASAGGDVRDVATLVRSYQRVSEAGWPMHVAHNAWSVWNGHMPEEWLHELERRHGHDLHRKRFMWEMPNQTAVSVALNDYRQTGIVVIPSLFPFPVEETICRYPIAAE